MKEEIKVCDVYRYIHKEWRSTLLVVTGEYWDIVCYKSHFKRMLNYKLIEEKTGITRYITDDPLTEERINNRYKYLWKLKPRYKRIFSNQIRE